MRTRTSGNSDRDERPSTSTSTSTSTRARGIETTSTSRRFLPWLAWVACALVAGGCASPATVYVVRHGEAWTNVTPPPGMKEEEKDALTPKGREQAKAAGESLRGQGVKVVLCSPKGRTRETAAAIQKQLGLAGEPEVVPALVHLAEGESPAEGQRRALAAVRARDAEGPLVVVTHSDIAALLIGSAAKTPLAECEAKHKVATGSVTRIELGE